MNKLNKKRTLSVIIFSIIIIVFVFTFSLLYTTFIRSSFIEDTKNNIEDILNKNTKSVDIIFQQNLDKMRMVSTNMAGYQNEDRSDLINVLSEMSKSSQFSAVAIADKNGNVVTSNPVADGCNVAYRNYFKEAIEGKPNVSQPLFSEYDNQLINIFTSPIYDSNKNINGIAMGIYLNRDLLDIMKIELFGEEYKPYLFAADGTVINIPTTGPLKIQDNLFTNEYSLSCFSNEDLESIRGDFAKKDIFGIVNCNVNNDNMMFAYTSLSSSEWCLGILIPESIVEGRVQTFTMNSFLFSFLIVLVVAFFGLYIILYQNKSRKELQKKSEEFMNLAYVDTLTGYSTWSKFESAVPVFLKDYSHSCALVSFDIDKFRAVNDMFGHEYGNKILKVIADIVNRNIGPDEIFCRVNSDNFYILVSYNDKEEIVTKIKNIIQDAEYQIAEFKPVLSFGVYPITERNISVRKMGDRADIAKRTVKYGNESCCALYTAEMIDEVRKEKEIEDIMEIALERCEFIVYYQPKIDLNNTAIITGAEALVRWLHKGKLIPPGKFIPLFEKNHFVTKIDLFVLEEVCKMQKRWRSMGYNELLISVNMSRVHLLNPEFPSQLKSICDKYNVSTSSIEIEITESAAFEDLSVIIKVFETLKEYGFKISIDDLGTGYSSLNMLKDLPVDVLKIDREFLTTTGNTKRASEIIAHVIALAVALEMETICEGIETEDQVILLRSLGCDMAQGYYFARPMPVDHFEELISTENVKGT